MIAVVGTAHATVKMGCYSSEWTGLGDESAKDNSKRQEENTGICANAMIAESTQLHDINLVDVMMP